MKQVDINWEEFFEDDRLSLEEERNTSVAVSEYLARKDTLPVTNDAGNPLKGKKLEKVQVNISSLSNKIVKRSKYTKNELVDLLNNREFVNVNPAIPFPKIKSLAFPFSFLNKLSSRINQNSVFQFKYDEYKEMEMDLINSLVYLGFFEENIYNDESFYTPTSVLFEFKKCDSSKQFVCFIQELVRHKAIKECLMLQVYSESFDTMTKDILVSRLVEDLSILNENLPKKELDDLMYNIRRWYLEIKNCLIKS